MEALHLLRFLQHQIYAQQRRFGKFSISDSNESLLSNCRAKKMNKTAKQ